MSQILPSGIHEMLPFWNKLTVQQQNPLQSRAILRRFSKNEQPHQGGDCDGLFLVKSGQLRVFILSDSGKEITLYRLLPWDICLFSASCIMKNISFDLFVEAEKDSQLWVIPAVDYEKLMHDCLPVMEFTNQLMQSRFSDVMWVMEQVLFSSFDSRLASFLTELSVIEQTQVLLLTHDEIARNLGSVREVVTRMLNYLASEGLLQLSRGRIEILDSEKLRKLAG